MNYPNQFFNPYGFMQQAPQPIQPTQVVKVNGENGAKAYQMGANSSALLLDESGLLVWLVTSDVAGYRTVTAYDITPHQSAPAPDFGSLETRISDIEKRLGEMTNGNTKRPASVGKKSSDDATD